MGFIYIIAVALVLATIGAALFTGQQLGDRRKAVFQLEMTAEELRRRVADLEEGNEKTQGMVRALRRLRQEKNDTICALYDELQELRADDGKEIGVSVGLRQNRLELEAA
jgi:predicted  nucleic acid-binding Zn-ribbon protein